MNLYHYTSRKYGDLETEQSQDTDYSVVVVHNLPHDNNQIIIIIIFKGTVSSHNGCILY